MKTAAKPQPQPPKPRGAQLFALVGVGVLLATSLFWAILSARLQANNADNLIDSYLFESAKVFHTASFPGAHSFLLKWPLFLVAAMLGNGISAITVLTVLSALVPVGALLYVVWRVEKRPAVFGLWCLALSSMLLLVPAQPSPGTLLPVNFAMLATRNIEYAVLIAIFALLVSARRLRDWRLLVAGVLAALLVASDKLFAPLLITAVLGTVLITGLQQHKDVLRALRRRRLPLPLAWIAVSVVAIIAAYGLLIIINASGLTNIAGQTTTSPYGFQLTLHTVATALGYGVLSLLTLFGANSAYDQLQLVHWPHQALTQYLQPGNFGYIVNLVLLALVVLGTAVFKLRFIFNKHRSAPAALLADMLLFASLAALIVYVITNHYYPVDSRYLTIFWFAMITSAAVTLSRLKIRQPFIDVAALVLLITLPFSIAAGYQQYHRGQQAVQNQRGFNIAAATQLNRYHVDVVIGNYWDVAPIRSLADYQPTIVPLASCTQPQTALSSRAWQQAERRDSVGYVINASPEPTGFPHCSPADVQKAFGTPTRQLPLNTPGHQVSMLYIYDNRIKKVVTKAQPRPVAPARTFASTPNACAKGSLLDITAHEDDDLIFMNPDLQHRINDGWCVTSAYLTAGDAGQDGEYPEGRSEGTQAAYARMYHVADNWQKQRSTLAGKNVTTYTLRGVPQVKLVFFGLPDGNLQEQGFPAHHLESLAQLRDGRINNITAIDGSETFTAQELTVSLAALMGLVQPSEVHTQDYSTNLNDGDHSDHHAAGYFAKQAYKQYGGLSALSSYIGYPGRLLAANVTGAALDDKRSTFYTYADHDPAACNSTAACASTAYVNYLQRQYSHEISASGISSARTVSGISSTRTTQHLLTNKAGGVCAISDRPHSLYCTAAP